MKQIIQLGLALALGSAILAACSSLSSGPVGGEQTGAPSKSGNIGNLALEMVGANLPTVDSSSLTAQSVEGVRVRHTRNFSNGDSITYISVGEHFVDGDMILGKVDDLQAALDAYQLKLDGKLQSKGAMTNRCTARTWFGGCVGTWQGVRWPQSSNGTTYVPFEPLTLGTSLNGEIRAAMESIQRATNTNILFVEDTSSSYRLYFTADNTGCWSYLGWQQNRQQLNLGPGCQIRGTAIHELLHALGMMHEHQRPERDSFITVNSGNLTQKAQDAFTKFWTEDYAGNQYTSYDFGSIMHYPQYTFDSAFVLNTSAPMFYLNQSYGGVVGQRDDLSALDIQTLRLRYGQ